MAQATQALESWLPDSGGNLFQRIKQRKAEAEARGVSIINLSIGQPQGPALLSARKAAAEAVMSDEHAMHEYQDNGSPGIPNFARQFVNGHVRQPFQQDDDKVAFLPIPGIKPMLGPVVEPACLSGVVNILTCTNPGYPTPKVWAEHLDVLVLEWPMETTEFMLTPPVLKDNAPDLVMANYPHNPSGQVMTEEAWVKVCEYCRNNGIRLFNDAAYAALVYDGLHANLADIAPHFEGLSWAEAYSASKVIANGTGWRVGAMVGSPDFIGDIATIKGETDSGFAAPMAAGALAGLSDQAAVNEARDAYQGKLRDLYRTLRPQGMEPATDPKAGFFTLWHVPNTAFGEEIDGDGERFNDLMIERCGVVGVPFGSFIRYAVCGSDAERIGEIENAFAQANVKS